MTVFVALKATARRQSVNPKRWNKGSPPLLTISHEDKRGKRVRSVNINQRAAITKSR